jgi:hypothetical protein
MPARKLDLPFAHLNLRRNPFGELLPEERAALAVVSGDLDRLAARLRSPGFVVQFLGEMGRGKTTHILALRARFPEAPYVHIAEDEPPPPIPRGPVVFVDETQRLPRRTRRRLFRRGDSLAIGTHEDHARELRRAGSDFETVEVGGITVGRLERIVARRIEAARRGPGPLPRVPRRAAEAFVERFGDDVRAIEHHLYELFQELPEVCDVEV